MSTDERDNPKIMEAWDIYEIAKKWLDDFHVEWQKKFSGAFGWYYKYSPGQRYTYKEYLRHYEDRLDGAKISLHNVRFDAKQAFERREREIQARTRRQFTATCERWGLPEDFTEDDVHEMSGYNDLAEKLETLQTVFVATYHKNNTLTHEEKDAARQNYRKLRPLRDEKFFECVPLREDAIRRKWGLPEDFTIDDVSRKSTDYWCSSDDYPFRETHEKMLIKAADLLAEARKIDAEKDPEIIKAKAEAEKASYWENVTTLGADSEPENEPIIEINTVSEIDPETVAESDFVNNPQKPKIINYSQQVEDARKRWFLPQVFTEPNVKERYPVMVENAEADELDRVHEEYEILMKAAA